MIPPHLLLSGHELQEPIYEWLERPIYSGLANLLLNNSFIRRLQQGPDRRPKWRGCVIMEFQVGQEGGDLCSICIAEFQQGKEILQLPCKHNFHRACIKRWLKRKMECPLCRTGIEKA